MPNTEEKKDDSSIGCLFVDSWNKGCREKDYDLSIWLNFLQEQFIQK